jgi:hypothetical protein
MPNLLNVTKKRQKMKVPWISKRRIAGKAPDLIENFQDMAGYPVRPPIPVEDIVEHCINLRLIYDDIEKNQEISC